MVAPAVRLQQVSAGYAASSVLADLDLEVAAGELVGVVGPSGSGKTTLLRLLTNQVGWHHGRVEVLGTPLRGRRAPDAVGYVPQLERVDWDFPLTVEEVVLLGATETSARRPWFSRRERREATGLLERLGIAALAHRQIRELSGGQQQRMFLARALMRRSRLLVLDEPTSGVDLATRRDILALLGELRDDGLTIVLTTHDLNFVAAHLPRVVFLNRVVTADGAPGRVLDPAVLDATYGTPMRVLRDRGRVVVVDDDDVLAPVAGPGAAEPAEAAAGGHAAPTRERTAPAPMGAGSRGGP